MVGYNMVTRLCSSICSASAGALHPSIQSRALSGRHSAARISCSSSSVSGLYPSMVSPLLFILPPQRGDQRGPRGLRRGFRPAPQQVFQRVVPLMQGRLRRFDPFERLRQPHLLPAAQPMQVRKVRAPHFPLEIIQQRHFHASTSLLPPFLDSTPYLAIASSAAFRIRST